MKKALWVLVLLLACLPAFSALALYENPSAEYVGDWAGYAEDTAIDLTFTIREDSTGEFTFRQRGNTETGAFTILMEGGMDGGMERGIFIAFMDMGGAVNGSYTLQDGVLTLNMEVPLPSGRVYAYTVDCKRMKPVDTGSADATPDSAEAVAPTDGTAPKRGFATKEACVLAVAKALCDEDTQAFLDCFAIPEAARGFDLAAYVERVGALMLSRTLLPPDDSFAIAFNETYLTNDLLLRVTASNVITATPELRDKWGVPMMSKEHTTEEMLTIANPDPLYARLTFTGMCDPGLISSKYEQERVQIMVAKNYKLYGAAEFDEAVVIFELDGQKVYMGLGLVRYDDGWLAFPGITTIQSIMGAPSYALFLTEDML